MNEDSGIRLGTLKASGGMSASPVFLQIQADILGITVCMSLFLSTAITIQYNTTQHNTTQHNTYFTLFSARPENIETTALGAAIAAGIAIGIFTAEELLHSQKGAETTWSPNISEEDRKAKVADWNKAVDRSFGWAE